ncbi:hypothetical protein [Alteribacter aurantiacus]|uniref:hypothetical protein n=1 Tax=Alteribacter aurantiacus TaxID=254410 RepID=UPI0004077583|nr:hypothetical protein [Alteribacter aurantiacus]
MNPEEAFMQYAAHSSAVDHYRRLKEAEAENSDEYYRLAEREAYHQWQAVYYRRFFKSPLA